MRNDGRGFWQRRLEQHVLELCSLIKDICPNAEIEIQVPGIAELDARLRVVVDDDKWDEVFDAVTKRTSEIYMEEGYDIGKSILERSAARKLAAAA